MPLDNDTVAALRDDYRNGFGPSQAASRRNVAYHSVRTMFSRFERAGIARRLPQPYAKWQHGPVAPYTAAPWIGKALTAPPVPIGPDWIGKPA